VLSWIEKKYPLHELMPHVRTYAAKISSAGPPAAPKAP